MTPLPDLVEHLDDALEQEWLLTNHLGGFASSTVVGLNTRKYHGLLIAAMLPPGRRMVILSRVEETLIHDGWPSALSCNEYPGTIYPEGHHLLKAFNNDPWPRWAYQGAGWTLQKELRLVRDQNLCILSYTLLASDKPVSLELRPLMALRPLHDLMYQWNASLDAHPVEPGQWRIPATCRTPEVFFAHQGDFTPAGCWYLNTIYRRERQRGYAGLEDLWMPGVARWTLSPGQSVYFACSTDPIDLSRIDEQVHRHGINVASIHHPMVDAPLAQPPVKQDEAYAHLCQSADQFVVHGRDASTHIIAGYPWMTTGGRDALIAMDGLLLATGRLSEARQFLLTLGDQLRNGLIPSSQSVSRGPLYDSADASLWFIHAVNQFARYGGDEPTLRKRLFPFIQTIIRQYLQGTDLGIGVDADGLVHARQANTPTTWMNARLGAWIVTPRHGKPVELSALWYNALCIGVDLAERFGLDTLARSWRDLSLKTRASFNRVFWNSPSSGCFDVVDGEARDGSIRPNQLLAISLTHPVLDPAHHGAVLDVVRAHLLTPMGLRTLSPSDPQYVARYAGDVASRDRAYHNGSVYPWLLGAYTDAYIRLNGRGELSRKTVRQLLGPCIDWLDQSTCRQLPELFDGDSPHRPGGCIASAINLGEVLRALAHNALGRSPCDRPAPAHFPIATIIVPQSLAR